MSDVWYIYAIGREEGPIKVGITSNLLARIKALQNGCAFPLKLLYVHPAGERDDARSHEKKFHEVYDHHRLEGEWFNLEATLVIEGIDAGFQQFEWISHEAIFKKRYGVAS